MKYEKLNVGFRWKRIAYKDWEIMWRMSFRYIELFCYHRGVSVQPPYKDFICLDVFKILRIRINWHSKQTYPERPFKRIVRL